MTEDRQEEQKKTSREVAELQLDMIIDFASLKNNISKDLRQGLLIFRKPMVMAKQGHEKLIEITVVVVPMKLSMPKSTKTET